MENKIEPKSYAKGLSDNLYVCYKLLEEALKKIPIESSARVDIFPVLSRIVNTIDSIDKAAKLCNPQS